MRLFGQKPSVTPQVASAGLLLFRKSLDNSRTSLRVNAPGDVYEQEAERVAAQVMRAPQSQLCSCGGSCQKCSGHGRGPGLQLQGGRPESHADPLVQSLLSPAGAVSGPGRPLDPETRAFMQPRFGHDFAHVRVHSDGAAAASARALQARAYTLGNHIVFGAGQYAPATDAGRSLVAHELTHVLQQSIPQRAMRQTDPAAPSEDEQERRGEGIEMGGVTPVRVVEHCGLRVSRDLAVPPTRPDVEEPVLTEAQLRRAVRYNAFRFKDPYSLAVIRDIVGIPRFPAVSDEDLARAVARYQAGFGLTPDGRIGPETTRRLVAEARAENLPRDAAQLRADNYVTWLPATGTHNGCAAPADAAGRATFFQWDVNFSTSLRDGWIVQEIVNARTRTTCGGAAIPETLTPRYWEAWWVNGAGDVRVPTAINAARTRATTSAAPAPADDLWRRAAAAPSRGNWSMTGRLYTCLRLPAGFAAGNVPEALALPSTTVAPSGDELGLVAARRRAGGNWNCCGAPATHFHNP